MTEDNCNSLKINWSLVRRNISKEQTLFPEALYLERSAFCVI